MQLLLTIKATLFLSLLLLIPLVGKAQPRLKPLSHYKIDRWSPANGFPFNGVNAIVQSHEGYLWIGALEGLYRFDGVRFVSFDRHKCPGLLSTRIMALFEDSKGSLWIGTQGGGLSTLHNGKITTITSKQGLPSDYVKAVAEDSLGAIWVGTDGEGVCKMMPDTMITYNHENSPIDGRVTSIAIDQENDIWVGTFGGLYRLSDNHWTRFGKEDGLSSDSVLCLHETDGEMWIGTYGQGITIFRNGAFAKFGREQGLRGGEVVKGCRSRYEHPGHCGGGTDRAT